MARLTSHLLSQGSFYPLHPSSEEVNIDYEQSERYSAIAMVPNLLILPSDLAQFVREVEGCTVINPGRVTKGEGPGTWARISVREGTKEAEVVTVDTKVEVVRI